MIKSNTKETTNTGCPVCEGKMVLSYKDPIVLRKFTSSRGRIPQRSHSGLCAKHQRKLALEIKKARILALIPFVDLGV